MFAGVISLDYQGEIRLHNGGKKEYDWNTDFLGHLLALSCSVIKISVQLQQSNSIQAGLWKAQTLQVWELGL
jgi:hypothetical protein